MKHCLLRRLLGLVPLLLGISFLSFVLIQLSPGDPAEVVIRVNDMTPTPELLAEVRTQLGLDRPFPERYLRWLADVLRGDLGMSYVNGRPVAGELARALPPTLMLAGTAAAIMLVCSLAVALVCVRHEGRVVDRLLRALLFLGTSVPAFWAGLLLIWLFYFLTRRGWGAFLGSFLPCVAVAMVNYFKIRLRSDPFLAADLTLISEAGGIVGNYSLDVDWLTWLTLGALLAGLLFSVLLIPKWPRRGWGRAFAAASCAAVCAVSCASLFINSDLYQSTDNSEYINPWSDVEVFVSKGCLYPFLYSMRDMFPAPPPGYDGAQAQSLLEAFSDADIPADKQVSVMGIMLEAFCDLTDFDFMAGHPDAARVYDPWHALAEQGVSGRLLTNIFAGGTVDSEWGFLSGYSQHDDFRRDTDSYVWYLRDQGYQTFFSHPGYGWFYNRQNVNDYLGFQDSWFTENHYGALVDPTSAIYHSDDILVRELLAQLIQRTAEGPCFSFSVSYQNHGPYESAYSAGVEYFTPANSGMAAESCHIWNN